jgi:hypothetical protein
VDVVAHSMGGLVTGPVPSDRSDGQGRTSATPKSVGRVAGDRLRESRFPAPPLS